MDQRRTVSTVFDGAQDGQQLVQIVPVNRPDVGKAQRFEQSATHGHAFEHVFGALRAFAERFGQQAHCTFGRFLQVLKRRTGVKLRQVRRQRTDRRCDAHFVVV